MKTIRMPPAVAFPEVSRRPTHLDVLQAIGARGGPGIATLTAWLNSLEGARLDLAYTASVGWYEVAVVRRRRVYYLMPKRGNFTLNVIVSARAIMSLVEGPHASAIAQRLIDAKRFPEGTLFSFDRRSLDARLAIALCEAKLAHH